MLERAFSGQWLAIIASCALHVAALVVVQSAISDATPSFKKVLVADLTLVEQPAPPPLAAPQPPARPAPRRIEPPRVIEKPTPVVPRTPEPETKVEPPPVAAPAPAPPAPVAAAPVTPTPPAPDPAPAVSLPRAEPAPSVSGAPSPGISMTTTPPAPPRVAALPPPSLPSIGEAVASGRVGVVHQPAPRYPAAARIPEFRGTTRTTVLKVHVLETGRTGEMQVHETAGHPALDEAAREAVGRWRFLPGTDNGKPVGLWVLIPIEFRLR